MYPRIYVYEYLLVVLDPVLAGMREGFRLELWRRMAVPGHRGSTKIRNVLLLCASRGPFRNLELFSSMHACGGQ